MNRKWLMVLPILCILSIVAYNFLVRSDGKSAEPPAPGYPLRSGAGHLERSGAGGNQTGEEKCESPGDIATLMRLEYQLISLVLSLTHIKNRPVVELLTTALHERGPELCPLLRDLKEFAFHHACPSCNDTRPLPKTSLDTKVRLPHTGTWRGLGLPVISVTPTGRLGNLMGEYATLFALQKIYNATAVLIPDFYNSLRTIFKGISIPVIEELEGVQWTRVGIDFGLETGSYQAQELAAAGLLGAKQFLFTDYPFEIQIFNAFREEVLQELAFNDTLVNKATARLRQFSKEAKLDNDTGPVTSVGVHVRMTDYTYHMDVLFAIKNLTSSYPGYLRRSMQYFLERHSNVVFVVTSDDIGRAREIVDGFQLKNVFVSQGSPEEDMCLLSLCDHHIITCGSYGLWSAYLGRGTTIYPEFTNASTLAYPFRRPLYDRAQLSNFIPMYFR